MNRFAFFAIGLLLLASLCTIVLLSISPASLPASGNSLAKDSPILEGVSLNGPRFSTAQWKGRVILVDFWASWCGPCRLELPRVAKLYAEYHDRGFEVLGISSDNSKSDLHEFIARNPDICWPQLFDENKPGVHVLAISNGITEIPTMWLIDRRGVLQTTDARTQMEDLIPKLLAEKP